MQQLTAGTATGPSPLPVVTALPWNQVTQPGAGGSDDVPEGRISW
ncbi:hypothetical protein [Myceligenerans halotolerans]